jgi:predicted membrane GTPase involved in stress response
MTRACVCVCVCVCASHSAGKDIKVGLDEPRNMSLDDALEYINDDELVEVSRTGGRVCVM